MCAGRGIIIIIIKKQPKKNGNDAVTFFFPLFPYQRQIVRRKGRLRISLVRKEKNLL